MEIAAWVLNIVSLRRLHLQKWCCSINSICKSEAISAECLNDVVFVWQAHVDSAHDTALKTIVVWVRLLITQYAEHDKTWYSTDSET